MTDPSAPLLFDRPVILLGGGWTDTALLGQLARSGSPVIAADGGANCLADTDLVPEAIIGDMDSLDGGLVWPEHTRLVHLEEQDTTDLEKCLYSVEAPRFIGLGFTGKRLDHTLSALHVLLRYAEAKPTLLAGEEDWVWTPCGDLVIELPVGSRLSLFPLAVTRFERSLGLKYPLDGLVLAPGERIGTSNEVSSSPVHIEFDNGSRPACALLLPRKLGACAGEWLGRL